MATLVSNKEQEILQPFGLHFRQTEACKELVRRFRLQFAAIDLLVTPDGQYVFVDLNSNGQWGWIENHTGLPLTETLVNLLERGQAGEDEKEV